MSQASLLSDCCHEQATYAASSRAMRTTQRAVIATRWDRATKRANTMCGCRLSTVLLSSHAARIYEFGSDEPWSTKSGLLANQYRAVSTRRAGHSCPSPASISRRL